MSDLTFEQLQAETEALVQAVARSSERIKEEARYISEEATDTARVADNIGAMRVDTATVAETKDLSQLMAGLSDEVEAYAAAGNATAKAAQAVHDQNQASYGGMNEAIHRSPVGPEIFELNREWLRQE